MLLDPFNVVIISSWYLLTFQGYQLLESTQYIFPQQVQLKIFPGSLYPPQFLLSFSSCFLFLPHFFHLRLSSLLLLISYLLQCGHLLFLLLLQPFLLLYSLLFFVYLLQLFSLLLSQFRSCFHLNHLFWSGHRLLFKSLFDLWIWLFFLLLGRGLLLLGLLFLLLSLVLVGLGCCLRWLSRSNWCWIDGLLFCTISIWIHTRHYIQVKQSFLWLRLVQLYFIDLLRYLRLSICSLIIFILSWTLIHFLISLLNFLF